MCTGLEFFRSGRNALINSVGRNGSGGKVITDGWNGAAPEA